MKIIDIPLLWQLTALGGAFLLLALVDLFRAIALRHSPAWLWKEDHWLLTSRGDSFHQEAGEFLFLTAAVLYSLKTILRNSTFHYADWTGADGRWDLFVETIYSIALILIVIKLLFFTRYSWRQLLCAAVLLTPVFISHVVTQDSSFFLEILLILGAKGEDFRRLLKALVLTIFVCSCFLLVFSMSGIIPMDSAGGAYVLEPRNRYAFGYLHPNILSLYMAALIWGWLLLKWHRLCLWDWLAMAAFDYAVYEFTNSRSICLNVLASLLMGLVFFYFPRFLKPRIWPYLFALIPPLFTLSPLLPCLFYEEGTPFWDNLNNAFSGRMAIFYEHWNKSGWSLWGINKLSGDSVYFYILVVRGIVCWILFMAVLSVLIIVLVRRRYDAELAVMTGLLLIGLTERTVLMITTAAPFWLFNALLFGLPFSQWPRFSRPRPARAAASRNATQSSSGKVPPPSAPAASSAAKVPRTESAAPRTPRKIHRTSQK